MTLPIRVRLTLWYVLLLAVILVATGFVAVAVLRREMTAGVDRTLRSSTSELATDVSTSISQSESEFRDQTDTSLGGLPRDVSAAQIVASDGTVTLSAGNTVGLVPMLPAETATVIASGGTIRTVVLGGSDYRLVAEPVTVRGTPSTLIVATSIEEMEAALHRLVLLLAIVIPLGIGMAGLGGWWLAATALRPVARMTDEASAIGADRLGDRVDEPATMDEIGRLAVTLNAMLDRIQSASDQQRAFVSNASHELRTPLAVMRAELDVSLSEPDLSEEARTTLSSAREEVDRMSAIVDDLLLLARMDEGALPLEREPVDIGTAAERVTNAVRPLAAERGITLTVHDGERVVVVGDHARLEQVIRNLLENAIKYSPEDGNVSVVIRREGGSATLVVANQGPAIPSEALPRIFDRFYRADPARGRAGGGSGLGLAIVRELVEAQGGRVWVASDVDGTRIGCDLPAAGFIADRDGAEPLPHGPSPTDR